MTLDPSSNKQIKEFYSQYDMAHGNVLLTGFGFGILSSWIASKPNVESVTVVEISEDVVNVFLKNNSISDKIKIIIDDASKYKDENTYDCLFLDHYETQNDFWFVKDLKRISKNIPNHKIFWSWSLEDKALKNFYGYKEFYIDKIIEDGKDSYMKIFYDSYINFKNNILNIDTLPDLDPEKITKYLLYYYDKLDYI